MTVLSGDSVTLDLSTQSGSVDFEGSLGDGSHTIPADSALNVDLKTNFGSIQSDIPISVILTGETEQNH